MYRPSLVEWLAGLGIIAYGLTFFSLGVRYLRVVDHSLGEAEREPATALPEGHGLPA
jgi:Ni/Fe-hydrogenase subunit HybB-like protein